MATLGDPLTDLALLLVYDNLPRLIGDLPLADASTAPATRARTQLAGVRRGGRPRPRRACGLVPSALAHFKLAVILEGIHYRYLQGQTVGGGFDTIGDAVGAADRPDAGTPTTPRGSD